MSGNEPPMKQVRVRELEVGMTLARAVHTDDGSRLFDTGEELSVKDIERLNKWDIRRVYVKLPDNDNNIQSENAA